MDKITIMSMNCQGLGDVRKRRDVMQFVRSKRFSIVFLQDTHLTENTVPYFNTLWHGKAHHSCFSSRRRGTSILINSNLPYNLIAENKSECGNFHMLVCNIQGADDKLGQVSRRSLTDVTLCEWWSQGAHCMNYPFPTSKCAFTLFTAFKPM